MRARLFQLADQLFEYCYPLYHILYRTWKAFADRQERILVKKYIEPGMVIVDVGANIGVYTRYFSSLTGMTGCVYAFEPSPTNFERLRNNVGHLTNVVLTSAAVGTRSGTIRLYKSDELNVDHRTYDSGEGRQWIEVPVRSLDDYFPAGNRVDFIKIDVQGFELSVLRGAERILRDNVDIKILMEYWPYGLEKALVSPHELIAYIESLGFEIVTMPGESYDVGNFKSSGAADKAEFRNLILLRTPSA